MKKHVIDHVIPGSIAEECGFEKGDKLISINGNPIEDTFDYQYLISDDFLLLLAETKQGEEVELEIEKDAGEDLGLVFENSFMDNYRSCKNKCIFCFIDQMPPGMRETLYFKDDDTRLSFLQGNYVTLTNLNEEDINRIIKYRMEPINISFQTMNEGLRCKMLNNRFAGEALKKADILYDAGIEMNGQIVLCKGVNDKEELEYSLKRLYEYVPVLRSVSIVPVGLSRFREGLYPLEPFNKADASVTIDCIEQWQKKAYAEKGVHFVHASDEWYLLAERPLPEEERYDGYLQLENGVGMVRNFVEEFTETFREEYHCEPRFDHMLSGTRNKETDADLKKAPVIPKNTGDYSHKCLSFATGRLFGPILTQCVKNLQNIYPDAKLEVYEIRNNFFGEMITVAGLVTGADLMGQLKDSILGEALVLPDTMLRYGEDVFLDDVKVCDIESALHCKVDIVKSTGRDLIKIVQKYLDNRE